MKKIVLTFPNERDTHKGFIECRKCHNDKLQVKLVGPLDSDVFSHVDFYCPICGDFVLHFNITPYAKRAEEWMIQAMNDPRIEVNGSMGKDEIMNIDISKDVLE